MDWNGTAHKKTSRVQHNNPFTVGTHVINTVVNHGIMCHPIKLNKTCYVAYALTPYQKFTMYGVYQIKYLENLLVNILKGEYHKI